MILDGTKNPSMMIDKFNHEYRKDQAEHDCEGEKKNIMVSFITSVRSKPTLYDDGESSDEDISLKML